MTKETEVVRIDKDVINFIDEITKISEKDNHIKLKRSNIINDAFNIYRIIETEIASCTDKEELIMLYRAYKNENLTISDKARIYLHNYYNITYNDETSAFKEIDYFNVDNDELLLCSDFNKLKRYVSFATTSNSYELIYKNGELKIVTNQTASKEEIENLNQMKKILEV